MATHSVYYMKGYFFCKGVRGYDWLREKDLLPDPVDLIKTHVFLKLIEARNPEDVYLKMQGESWSLTGDAREFVASKGLSVGDIVVDRTSRVAFILDRVGFRFFGTVTTFGER